MTKSPICLRCGSLRVIDGELKSSRGDPWFMPHAVRTPAKILSFVAGELMGISLLTNLAYVCLDCGLLWADVGLTSAEGQVERWGSDDLKARLRLSDELDKMLDELELEEE